MTPERYSYVPPDAGRSDALAWVRRAMDEMGDGVTEPVYDRWSQCARARGERPPSAWWLRRFGGLARLREELGGAPLNFAVTRAEVIERLRGGERVEWRALRRHFASHADARGAAGVAAPTLRRRRSNPAARRYSDEELLAALRDAAGGDKSITGAQYTAWQALYPGRPFDLTIRNRFGGWNAAVAAAGLLPHIDLVSFGRQEDPRRVWSDAQLVAWLREYASASGSTSMAGFGRWRTPGTPSAETFRLRFGGWNGALIAAGLVSEEEVEP